MGKRLTPSPLPSPSFDWLVTQYNEPVYNPFSSAAFSTLRTPPKAHRSFLTFPFPFLPPFPYRIDISEEINTPLLSSFLLPKNVSIDAETGRKGPPFFPLLFLSNLPIWKYKAL